MKKSSRLECPEPLWQILEALIPKRIPSKKGGRPFADIKKIVDGIFYALRTGIPWNDMPRAYASSSTCHRYFQEWQEQGAFQMAWSECLARYDEDFGIDWKKLNIDSSQQRHLWEGKKTGKSPVDRGKVGTKRSLLCDGQGIPLALAVHPSGQHDSTTIDELLDGLCSGELPAGSRVFLDKGYDSEHIREGFSFLGVQAIIPRRHPRRGRPWNLGKKRWQVERTFSWINRFAKARVRTEKSGENYLAILQIAAAWIIPFAI